MSGVATDGLRPVADVLTGPASAWPGVYVGVVNDNQDPQGQGRVQIHLPWAPDSGSERYEAWARVATLMAGNSRGTWFVPDPDDEVLVAFEGGDPRRPVVLGALWNGSDSPAETMASGNPKRTILTGAGVRITLDDSPGAVSLLLETPGGQRLTLKDSPASTVLEDSNGNRVTTESAGITISTSSKVNVQASTVQVDASMVTVNAAMSKFSGVVQCDTLIATTVVSSTYTPGAGNIW
jgi:uncharacterized protein involved in type VI secretion and phage assembly